MNRGGGDRGRGASMAWAVGFVLPRARRWQAG
jgi:hypothetical protein